MSKKQTELTPPDYAQCQCEVRTYKPFIMGGRVHDVKRCDSVPAWVAVEIEPGADGRCGSMSLCQPCAEQMLKDSDLRKRVQLQPIFHGATG